MSAPVAVCDPRVGGYGYIPSLAAGIVFPILFGLLTLYSLYLSFRKRLWYLTISIGGLLEFLGWIARAVAHTAVCSSDMFIMQITCLIVGPVFWSATLYVILGVLITHAPERSVLPGKLYLIIFSCIDLLSLILQAAGGGIAAGAQTIDVQDRGTNIMVAGVFVQIAGMTAFVVLGLIFISRVWSQRHAYGIRNSVLLVVVTSSLLIFLRNIYRCVELLEGWTGHLNVTEGFIIGLDAVPMVLCLTTLCFLGHHDQDGLLDRGLPSEEKHEHSSISS
ncbi:putative RTA1 domain protein [Taphrina deformans PYCC 5710]|uniref:RTA1 domain protein n=1 Tax=Taphrina deformans (strain PYCC 5710 / ATCC 11124 / CBS 356.35 / IMI 108563 / JCM 9778 / NBRC 8474) TaxID=1097556 RepID=R4XGY8_TAPDE|nr:putative RTA1 domain protein [Taphrina deformans PYCC 5710]|eukprot:CCG85148.1 putative RTA1 domain protein [Taphrina deformans PYCC 5710]